MAAIRKPSPRRWEHYYLACCSIVYRVKDSSEKGRFFAILLDSSRVEVIWKVIASIRLRDRNFPVCPVADNTTGSFSFARARVARSQAPDFLLAPIQKTRLDRGWLRLCEVGQWRRLTRCFFSLSLAPRCAYFRERAARENGSRRYPTEFRLSFRERHGVSFKSSYARFTDDPIDWYIVSENVAL